jgi:hypothetical protein
MDMCRCFLQSTEVVRWVLVLQELENQDVLVCTGTARLVGVVVVISGDETAS